MLGTFFFGGCLFFLIAIFGVKVAHFALALEGPVKMKEPFHKKLLEAMGLIEDLTLVSWKYVSDTKPAEMEITLSDGTVWHGQTQWWWDPVTRNNPPPGYNDFLCELREQIERKLLRAMV